MCSPGLNAVRKTVHAQCVPLLALHILQGGPSLCRKRVPVPQHAANCGARTNLLRCSRCHAVHFCGVKCQKVGRQRKTCALCTAKTWPRGLLGGRGLLGRPAVTGPRSRQGPLQSGGTCWGCMGDNRVCGHGFHSLDLGSMWGLALPGAGVWADSSSKPGPPSQPPPPPPNPAGVLAVPSPALQAQRVCRCDGGGRPKVCVLDAWARQDGRPEGRRGGPAGASYPGRLGPRPA